LTYEWKLGCEGDRQVVTLQGLDHAHKVKQPNPSIVVSDGKRLDEALICCDRLITINPEHVYALNTRARILPIIVSG